MEQFDLLIKILVLTGSYVHDHNLGRSVLGFCVVALGLFTGNAFYTRDHAYFFSNKRHAKTPEKIGDPRSSSGLAVMKQNIVPNWSWLCP